VTAWTQEQIRAQVRGFIEQEFLYMRPGVVIADSDSLMKKGVLDSMGVLEVMQFLTDTFGVTPADDEITEANLGSLEAIGAFVHARLK
jgi:acyl carrier protein